MKSPRILIYSAAARMPDGCDLNVGDEALTECLGAAMRNSMPHAVVRRLIKCHGSTVTLIQDEVKLGSLSALVREIRSADVVVLGGGTLLQEVPGLLRWQALICAIARACRKPIVIAAVGVEGLHRRTSRGAVRFICRYASEISVRDETSGELLSQFARRPVKVAADPVLLTRSRLPRIAANSQPVRARIAVNLTREAPDTLVAELAKVLAEFVARGGHVVGVAMDRRPDRDASALHRLASELDTDRYSELASTSSWRDVAATLASSELCVGMRLHFMLLAAITSAPLLAITDLPKTVAFASEFDVAYVPVGATADEMRIGALEAHAVAAERLGAMALRADGPIRDVSSVLRSVSGSQQ